MLIALTGGIASGKSTVARQFVALGATEIDADLLAREVVEPGSAGLLAVTEAFGTAVLAEDGSLDRQALATIAFSDEQSRKRLESILHPLIQQLSSERIKNTNGVVVYTIPLLVETKSPLNFDHTLAVSAPVETRVQRLIQHRGMTEQAARARINAQSSDQERESIADTVISSDCSMEELVSRATSAYLELTVGTD
ncbi:MAG: dephospho-CoA kinase [Aquiluna sp.]|nr:dephospho-CoA kinase [Aquiluna sp.]